MPVEQLSYNSTLTDTTRTVEFWRKHEHILQHTFSILIIFMFLFWDLTVQMKNQRVIVHRVPQSTGLIIYLFGPYRVVECERDSSTYSRGKRKVLIDFGANTHIFRALESLLCISKTKHESKAGTLPMAQLSCKKLQWHRKKYWKTFQW